MIKLLLLVIFFLTGSYALRADESMPVDQDFIKELSAVKSPFEDGYPKIVVPKPLPPKPKPPEKPKPVPVAPPVITLPELKLEGVIVGEEIKQAIINDQVVPLGGSIKGAEVISIAKTGAGVRYKGKKFFLKVE